MRACRLCESDDGDDFCYGCRDAVVLYVKSAEPPFDPLLIKFIDVALSHPDVRDAAAAMFDDFNRKHGGVDPPAAAT